MLQGKEVIAITADTATIKNPSTGASRSIAASTNQHWVRWAIRSRISSREALAATTPFYATAREFGPWSVRPLRSLRSAGIE